MLPATQYQLSNADDPNRRFTFNARIAVVDGGQKTGWQVTVTGEEEGCNPNDACKRLVEALAEVRNAIEQTAGRDLAVSVDVNLSDIGEAAAPEVASVPAVAPSTVSNIAGVVVEVREVGQPAAVPRPPGWPTGDTY